MDAATLNSYIGRAKNIKHVASWVNLKNEMLKNGATKAEVLHVSRYLQKGEAQKISMYKPVEYIDLQRRITPVPLCNFRDVAGGPAISYDDITRTVLINREVLNAGV